MKLTVTTNQTPIIDTKYIITRDKSKKRKKERRPTNVNNGGKYLPINSYFTCSKE